MENLKKRFMAVKTAVGGWCGRHRIASIAIGGVGFLLFWQWLLDGWWLVTEGRLQALAAYAELPAKEKVEAFSTLATALGLLVAAPSALLGVGLACLRTWNQHRDTELATLKLATESELAARKLDAEAFAKAVEQLGHAEIAIRMGAVLALQNLAEASPRRLLDQTQEILCAYVREKRPRTKEADEQPAVPLPTDVKLTLQVISRLNRINDEKNNYLNLNSTDLRNISITEACFKNINFSDSDLSGAKLIEADLENSKFIESNLQNASLQNANLQGADLTDADLRYANFFGANLQDAGLPGASLIGTCLDYANVENCHLEDTNLQHASTNHVSFKAAHLSVELIE